MHPFIKISLLLFLVVFLFTGCVSKSLTVEKREEGTVYSTPKIRLLGFGDTAGQDQDVSVLSEVICASDKQCEGDEYIVTLIHFGNFQVFEGKEASFLTDGQPVLQTENPNISMNIQKNGMNSILFISRKKTLRFLHRLDQ